MKAKVLKYKFDGNTIVAPYMELEPYAENVFISLARKNEYGNESEDSFHAFSRLLFYVSCIAGIASGVLNSHWLVAGIALLIWLLRFIMQIVVINQTAKEMGGNRKYYFSLPLFDLLQPIQSLNFKICRFFRGKGDFMRR